MEQPPDTYDYPNLPHDWESHREIIQRLYVTEDKALPDVVKEMKRLHNFVATERMYKRRISDWNLDKNVKAEEMRAIIACEAMRSQHGKQSTFYVRGRLVDRKKIDRFAQRKKIDRTALVDVHGIEHLDSVSMFRKGIKCVTPPTDGPTMIHIVSEEPTRERSKRGPTQSCTPENRGRKRTRNLEDNLDDQIAPPHSRHPADQECADSMLPQQIRNSHEILFKAQYKEKELATPSRQVSSSTTNSSANRASTPQSHGQPEDTPVLSNTETSRTTQSEWKSERTRILDQWNEAFGNVALALGLDSTPSITTASVPQLSSRSSAAENSKTTGIAEIHKREWQDSHDRRQAQRPRQHPNFILPPDSSDRAVDQTSQSVFDPIAGAFPPSLRSGSRSQSSQHLNEPYSQHYDKMRRASCRHQDSVEARLPWFPSDLAALKTALSTPPSDDSATSSASSRRINHQPSSQSSDSEPRPTDITIEDGKERRQHPYTSEQPNDTPSKLAIHNLLKAAHSEPSSGQRNIGNIVRTISDIYQDELYCPPKVASSPPQDNLQNSAQGSPLSSQSNSVFAKLFQASQNEHLRARSVSPVPSTTGERSPFTAASRYAIDRYGMSIAAHMKEQQKAEIGIGVLPEHSSGLSTFPPPRTVSPKEVALDYNEGEEDGRMPLFPNSVGKCRPVFGPLKCERINPSTGKPCMAVFSRSYDLTRHEDTIHNSSKRRKVRCQLCTEEKTFSRNDALTRHMRVVHPDVYFPGKT
ncbi:MAG: hypothetical protein Q9182_002123 [Xanthomendoza sp. 2 TL-2023]